MFSSNPRALTLAAAIALVAGACAHSSRPSTPRTTDSVDVGYGQQPKSKVTGAVSSLSEGEMSVRPLEIEGDERPELRPVVHALEHLDRRDLARDKRRS